MKKIFFQIILCCICFLSYSQTYVLNGDADSLNATEVRLTEQTTNQGGSLWYQTRLDLRYDFSITAELNLGVLDGGGADGIAFVLQPLSSDLGGLGGGIGYYGIDPSLAVEFDTWYNGDRNDPIEDHLAFMQDGDVTHGTPENSGPVYALPNIEDGLYHTATFTWNATAHTLTVQYLGMTYLYTGDIINTIFGGNPYVYWGFTGATGAAINDQRVQITASSFIEEMKISAVITPASCPGKDDGSIDITVTGGTGGYKFSWNIGSFSEDISGLSAGNYTVKVTDNNGVTVASTFTVTENADTQNPVLNCPADQKLCFNSSGTYTIPKATATDNCGLGAMKFEITGETTRSGTGDDASGNFNTGTSTITWTVTDANGNSASCNTTITINNNMVITVPDVFGVSPGGSANTIYLGYGPSSLTLTANPSGGTPPYSYSWSTGDLSQSTTITSTTVGCHTYTVTVTDAAGCEAKKDIKVCVVDVRCGHKMDKVLVCHVPPGNPANSHTICISPSAVPTHLSHGDLLGVCNQVFLSSARKNEFVREESNQPEMKLLGNPTKGNFTLQLNNFKETNAVIWIVNSKGGIVEKRQLQLRNTISNISFNLNKHPSGIYMVKVIIEGKVQTHKLILQR